MDKIDILKDEENVKLYETKNLKDLLDGNIKLVYQIMKNHGILLDAKNFEDVRQAGIMGLWAAINTWEPKKGKLSTHAHYLIRKAVQNEIARSHTISLGKHNSQKTTYQSFLDNSKDMEVLHLDSIIHDKKNDENLAYVTLRDIMKNEELLQNLKNPLQELIEKENEMIVNNLYKKVIKEYYKFLDEIEMEKDGTEMEIFSHGAFKNKNCYNYVKEIWMRKWRCNGIWRYMYFYNTVHKIKCHIRSKIKMGDILNDYNQNKGYKAITTRS